MAERVKDCLIIATIGTDQTAHTRDFETVTEFAAWWNQRAQSLGLPTLRVIPGAEGTDEDDAAPMIFAVRDDIPDLNPLAHFTDAGRAAAYADELRGHGIDVDVESLPVDRPRSEIPGAFYVHVDVDGNPLYGGPKFETGSTPNKASTCTARGSAPLPRFIGHGLTADEAIAAALAERDRWVNRERS